MMKKELKNRKSIVSPINGIYPEAVCKSSRNKFYHRSKLQAGTKDRRPSEASFDKLNKILIKDPEIRNQEEVDIIVLFLSNTEIMEKFRQEGDVISESSYQQIMQTCAKNMRFNFLVPGEVLFKIDHIGEYFYIIFKGSVTVLKPKPVNEILTVKQYFKILHDLYYKQDEIHIFGITLQANQDYVPIKDLDHLNTILLYIFKVKCKKLFDNPTMDIVEKIQYKMDKKGYNFSDFKIEMKDVQNLKKSLKQQYTKDQEQCLENLANFLSEKMKVTGYEDLHFEKYLEMIENKEKKTFVIHKYQKFLNLYTGQYFGDLALDKRNKKRSATIVSEDDSIVGFLSNDIYSKYIQAEKLKLKVREYAFINEQFFNGYVNPNLFDKYYSSNFTFHSYLRNFEVFKENTPFDQVILTKEGEIELSFNGSIIDIFNLIKDLVDKLICSYKNVKQVANSLLDDDLIYLGSIIYDDNLTKLRNKTNFFLKEIYKKRVSYLCKVSAKELLCTEEFLTKSKNYIFTGKVTSDSLKLYKIEHDHLQEILQNENHVSYDFTRKSISKAMSMIKRLNHIKNTLTNKYLQESTLNIKLEEERASDQINMGNLHKTKVKILSESISKPTGRILISQFESLKTNKYAISSSILKNSGSLSNVKSVRQMGGIPKDPTIEKINPIHNSIHFNIENSILTKIKNSFKKYENKSLLPLINTTKKNEISSTFIYENRPIDREKISVFSILDINMNEKETKKELISIKGFKIKNDRMKKHLLKNNFHPMKNNLELSSQNDNSVVL